MTITLLSLLAEILTLRVHLARRISKELFTVEDAMYILKTILWINNQERDIAMIGSVAVEDWKIPTQLAGLVLPWKVTMNEDVYNCEDLRAMENDEDFVPNHLKFLEAISHIESETRNSLETRSLKELREEKLLSAIGSYYWDMEAVHYDGNSFPIMLNCTKMVKDHVLDYSMKDVIENYALKYWTFNK